MIFNSSKVFDIGTACTKHLDIAKMMVKISRFIQGKYDYSKEGKGVYVILIYNTKILLPLTFDKETDKKRCASTENRTHDQDLFTWTML